MSNNMDESTWESYNEFYNELKTDKNSMDIFEDGLKCFSSYLCHASRVMLITQHICRDS